LAGTYHEARQFCGRALVLHRELGNRHGEAAAWDSLGYIDHSLGRFATATLSYTRSPSLFRQLGDRYHQADTLSHLGDTCYASNRLQ